MSEDKKDKVRKSPRRRTDVLIVGAGPVGLMLGNLLGKAGIRTRIVEKRRRFPQRSMAIGIMPPSLRLLETLGLCRRFVAAGVRVERAHVHGDRRLLGTLDLTGMHAAHPFVLSLPQVETLQLLRDRLSRWKNVTLDMGVCYQSLAATEAGLRVALQDSEGRNTWQEEARFLVGCDGAHSAVRAQTGLNGRHKVYPYSFLMADFRDETSLGADAHLFFTRQGAVESFPLPRGQRRWVVQTRQYLENAPTDYLIDVVRERAGVRLDGSDSSDRSAFLVHRASCRAYGRDRVLLCGDSAHQMSPIGGQGMNTGFGDAWFLSHALSAILNNDADVKSSLDWYDRCRRRAFSAAANRAARNMWIGTRRGRAASSVRNLFIRHIMLKPPFSRLLPDEFGMVNIPCNQIGEAEL